MGASRMFMLGASRMGASRLATAITIAIAALVPSGSAARSMTIHNAHVTASFDAAGELQTIQRLDDAVAVAFAGKGTSFKIGASACVPLCACVRVCVCACVPSCARESVCRIPGGNE